MASTDIFGVVIGKLCYRKKPCLIILLEIDKDLEIGFYHTILPLNLAICLWVKDGEKFVLDIKKIA